MLTAGAGVLVPYYVATAVQVAIERQEASLAPYRDEIEALFCPDAFGLELTRNEKFGIGIRGD